MLTVGSAWLLLSAACGYVVAAQPFHFQVQPAPAIERPEAQPSCVPQSGRAYECARTHELLVGKGQ